jgi:transcriptional regulator with XRE-family HTH domain
MLVNRPGEGADMFGERLRLARKRAGLSLRELADRLGGEVSAQAISKYENGMMFPSSSVLVALGNALDEP